MLHLLLYSSKSNGMLTSWWKGAGIDNVAVKEHGKKIQEAIVYADAMLNSLNRRIWSNWESAKV